MSTGAISKSGEVLQHRIHRELVNRPFQFQKRSQHFIGAHNETLSSSRCASTIQIVRPWNQRLRRSPSSTGFAEPVSDDFPMFHLLRDQVVRQP